MKKYLQNSYSAVSFWYGLLQGIGAPPSLSLVRRWAWNPGWGICSELYSQFQKSTALLNWLRDSFRGWQDGSLSKSVCCTGMRTWVQIPRANIKWGAWSWVPWTVIFWGMETRITGTCCLPAYLLSQEETLSERSKTLPLPLPLKFGDWIWAPVCLVIAPVFADSSNPSDLLDEDTWLERRRAEVTWQNRIRKKPRVEPGLPVCA